MPLKFCWIFSASFLCSIFHLCNAVPFCVPLFQLFVLFVVVTFGQMAFVSFYSCKYCLRWFYLNFFLWTTKIVNILYSRWKCHLNNNSNNKKKWDTHIKQLKHFERCTHIKMPTNFRPFGFVEHKRNAFCVMQTINKRAKHFVEWNWQTNKPVCGTEISWKNSLITFLWLCVVILLFVWHLCITCPSPQHLIIRNCVRLNSVFRLWLDRSNLLKLHVARPLRFFIIDLDSGFHSNDSVVKKKYPKTMALYFISLFLIWLGFEVPFYFCFFFYSHCGTVEHLSV